MRMFKIDRVGVKERSHINDLTVPCPRILVMKKLIVFLLLIFIGACGKPPIGIHTVVEREVIFSDSNRLSMTVVSPDDNKVRPAVLWFHGGGFAIGSRHDSMPLMRFCASMGYISITADYRLTLHGATFPDIMSDVQEAYDYVKQNARYLNINPDEIIVGGDSAGAHLALMVGLKNSKVKGIIDLYGSSDMVVAYQEFKGSALLGALLVLMRSTPDQDPEGWYNASPINFVTASSPPILIIHGTIDHVVPFNQSELLAQRCRDVGARMIFVPHVDAEHGWTLNPHGKTSLRTLPLIIHFLKQETSLKEYSK